MGRTAPVKHGGAAACALPKRPNVLVPMKSAQVAFFEASRRHPGRMRDGDLSHERCGVWTFGRIGTTRMAAGAFRPGIAPPTTSMPTSTFHPLPPLQACNGIRGVDLVSLPDRVVQLHPACEAASFEADQ